VKNVIMERLKKVVIITILIAANIKSQQIATKLCQNYARSIYAVIVVKLIKTGQDYGGIAKSA
jgi:hypothetical protein